MAQASLRSAQGNTFPRLPWGTLGHPGAPCPGNRVWAGLREAPPRPRVPCARNFPRFLAALQIRSAFRSGGLCPRMGSAGTWGWPFACPLAGACPSAPQYISALLRRCHGRQGTSSGRWERAPLALPSQAPNTCAPPRFSGKPRETRGVLGAVRPQTNT